MPAAGPGPLAPVHRITIWTAFLGALAYLAFEVKQIVDGAPGASVVRVALAIAAYLKHLRARLADKLTPRGSA
jgi:uncharacterized membrane protein (DUF2068 family)